MRCSPGLLSACLLGVVLAILPLGCSSTPTTSSPRNTAPGTSVSTEKKADTPSSGTPATRPEFKPGG